VVTTTLVPEGAGEHRDVTELPGVDPAQCPQPGAREGLLSPNGYVALMIDVATEHNEARAGFHEACQSAALDEVAT
jgi:hypothetical protein